jgi:gas vesicle protein
MNGGGKADSMLRSAMVGSVVGAAVGAGLALLLATRSARALREGRARRTRDLAERVVGPVPNGVIS